MAIVGAPSLSDLIDCYVPGHLFSALHFSVLAVGTGGRTGCCAITWLADGLPNRNLAGLNGLQMGGKVLRLSWGRHQARAAAAATAAMSPTPMMTAAAAAVGAYGGRPPCSPPLGSLLFCRPWPLATACGLPLVAEAQSNTACLHGPCRSAAAARRHGRSLPSAWRHDVPLSARFDILALHVSACCCRGSLGV